MKVYVAQRNATLANLRNRVREFEDLGVAGVLASDHLFVPRASDRAQGRQPHEPIAMLTTIAALSDRLSVGTIVSNTGFLHPGLLLRQFAQMAVLFGGNRVIAGLGAGWHRAEFAALGMRMPPHQARVARLAESAHLARQMFDTAWAISKASMCWRAICHCRHCRKSRRGSCWAAAQTGYWKSPAGTRIFWT